METQLVSSCHSSSRSFCTRDDLFASEPCAELTVYNFSSTFSLGCLFVSVQPETGKSSVSGGYCQRWGSFTVTTSWQIHTVPDFSWTLPAVKQNTERLSIPRQNNLVFITLKIGHLTHACQTRAQCISRMHWASVQCILLMGVEVSKVTGLAEEADVFLFQSGFSPTRYSPQHKWFPPYCWQQSLWLHPEHTLRARSHQPCLVHFNWTLVSVNCRLNIPY